MEHKGQRLIPSISYEQRPLEYLPKCFDLVYKIGVTPPVIVALTLTNVKGLEMSRDILAFDETYFPIQQDTLILPEAWVADLSQSPGKILRPMFDLERVTKPS